MKNVSSLKSTKTESPKTPGGISKSLLTPCRRVGLSRNWKKAGPIPFVSPISGSSSNSVEVKVEKREPRKQKQRTESGEKVDIDEGKVVSIDDNLGGEVSIPVCSTAKSFDISSTPTRQIEVTRKKKSKTLLSSLNTNTDIKNKDSVTENHTIANTLPKCNSKENIDAFNIINNVQNDSIPVKRSISGIKTYISPENTPKSAKTMTTDSTDIEPKKDIDNPDKCVEKNTTKSPNELTKTCIVVLQKKIFKTDKKEKVKEKDGVKSQVLFDSDSDDVPLCQLNKEETEVQVIEEVHKEKDFIESKRTKIRKFEDKATSIGGLKKPKMTVNKTKKPAKIPPTPLTNNSDFDDEDDFDFTNKKTILIRKSYEKVSKPLKARSTGSITQRDIDELKARIESKKKLLLARSMTEDTEELRTLIKKWQKGCQDALLELMDLMRNKFPDKQYMEYSEMLAMLKIPKHLVGYDEENDCFTTPDDKDLLLSNFQDV